MSASDDATVALIRRLELRRYVAMRESDVAALDSLLSDDLIYTHSFGERDSKSSYLDKVSRGFFVYEEVSNIEERIVVAGTAVLVAGTMKAVAIVDGVRRTINNASLAVWSLGVDGAWLLVGYQPTPLG